MRGEDPSDERHLTSSEHVGGERVEEVVLRSIAVEEGGVLDFDSIWEESAKHAEEGRVSELELVG